MAEIRRPFLRSILLSASLLALTACGNGDGIDLDLRGLTGGLDTSDASRQATQDRPRPDARGVISYPSFDVAVAKRGDTVESLAARIGTDASALARYNGLETTTELRQGEVIALPTRLADASTSTTDTGAAGTVAPGSVDITALASGALNRAPADTAAAPPPVQSGPEPVQHQVVRGETAYSIARLYNVSVRSLADWNGLGSSLTVREGQFLLIPIAVADAGASSGTQPGADIEETNPNIATEEIATVSLPGEGSSAPEPPSASTPLPDPEPETAIAAPAAEEVTTPNLGNERTSASASQFVMPVSGPIIRDFNQGENDGINIAASPGASVKAAADGSVVKILGTVNGEDVIIVRHTQELLTVYVHVSDFTVAEGDRVFRGQEIAKVRTGGPGFVQFQARRGTDAIDPIPFLN